jgi:tRNA uridine 5-carboxymethylaminomethyl modification enzyme
VDDYRWRRFVDRKAAIDDLRSLLQSTRIDGETLAQRLRRPTTMWADLQALHAPLTARSERDTAVEQVTVELKYGGYIERQAEQVERFRRLEHKPLPASLDYAAVPQLRAEARERLQQVRPRSLGQASRISGINPADVATLLVYLKRQNPDRPRKVRPSPGPCV